MSQEAHDVKKARVEFLAGKAKAFEVDVGSNLMQSLLANQVPVSSSCGGKGVCSKCYLYVLKGRGNLAPAYEKSIETDLFLLEKEKMASNCVISCQWLVMGDIQVDAKYW